MKTRRVGLALAVSALLACTAAIGYLVSRDDSRDEGADDGASADLLPIDPVPAPQGHDLDRSAVDDLLRAGNEPRPPPVLDPSETFSVWIESGEQKRQRIFAADGEVITLHGSLPAAGAADFSSLELDAGERRAITTRVLDSGATDLSDADLITAGPGTEDRKISISGHVRTVTVPDDEATFDEDAARTAALIADLFDLRWLDPEVESRAGPWAPARLTAWVEPGDATGEATTWPLPGAVLSHIDGTATGPGGPDQPYLCLDGHDAAAVFGLLEPDSERTVEVDDGEVVRRISLRFDFPYYVVHDRPCDEVIPDHIRRER